MQNYLNLLQNVYSNGTDVEERTGTGTRRLIGQQLRFDLTKGFPLLTTKRLNVKALIGEVIGFIRGVDNAADFRALGCNYWDANANKDASWLNNPARKGVDDLGRIYGVQLRHWRGLYGEVDQLANVIKDLLHNPTSRRIIMSAWNPAELNEMALPPCHMDYHFITNIEKRELSVVMHQRSADLFLGIPYNIGITALFLHIIASVTDFIPKEIVLNLDDCHIYHNHFDAVKKQLEREPIDGAYVGIYLDHGNVELTSDNALDMVNALQPSDIEIVNYQALGNIPVPIAVSK